MDAKRKRHAAALTAAGIPADEHETVLDSLAHAFEVHAATSTDRTAEAEALQGVITAAENAGKTERWRDKLQQRAVALPPGLRFSIFEYQGYSDGKQLADELPAETILARAKRLQENIHRGRGRPRSELASLLFSLLLLLESFFPAPSVTKNGSKADKLRVDGNGQDSLYSGPMLDLVKCLLDVEGVEYESRGAIGRELWAFVQQGQAAEERHAAGRCATAGCEGTLATPENWFCDECRTGMPVASGACDARTRN
nr:MAG TPA: hypothetical protein [Caudoviricetes sp.]